MLNYHENNVTMHIMISQFKKKIVCNLLKKKNT